MPYIVEHLSLYENGMLKKTNLVVKGQVIHARDVSVKRMKYVRLNMDRQIMIAAETIFGNLESWEQQGMHYAKECLSKGATTVIFPVSLDYEKKLDLRLDQARKSLMTFPLDYVLILRIPLSLVRPSLLRRCKQLRIPALLVAFHSTEELDSVAWSWMREAVFPYKLVLVPEYLDGSCEPSRWEECMIKEKFPYLPQAVLYEPLPKDSLKKLGIFPYRGIIRHDGDISYNVIEENRLECLIPDKKTYDDYIQYTVFHNRVIRAGDRFFLDEGPGEELRITVPGYFQ